MQNRDLKKLAFAVIGGMAAGAALDAQASTCVTPTCFVSSAVGADDKIEKKEHKEMKKEGFPWLQDPHICRGLNPSCKAEYKGKKNSCAGQALHATVKEHQCKGHNECAGEGGCGEKPGENSCKGKGECAVPLSEKTWEIARKKFEEAMTKAGKKFGDAPKVEKESK